MYSHSPLLVALYKHSVVTPQKIAIIEDNNQLSYSELIVNIRKAATFLYNRGIRCGSNVILSAHKDVEFIYLYYASHILGSVNVIIDAETNAERVQYVEEQIKPALCCGYISQSYQSVLFSDISINDYDEYVSDNSANLTDESIAEILFTTGTTGNPKGVCLSYFNIFSSANNINTYIGNVADDVEIIGLPICHSFGLGRVRCNLLIGSTCVLMGNFANVRLFFSHIEKYKATGFAMVPAAWMYIKKISGHRIDKYASQIKYIEIGSASLPIEEKKELLQRFPNTRICMHYGLTEASRSTFLEFHDVEHIQTIGKTVTEQVDIKIMDILGDELQHGIVGEICVSGNMVMKRYLCDNDTKGAFYGKYFRTGDFGYKDSEGYVYLVGREKEMINVGGKKVSPMEVEDAISALGVGDCVCVPTKDTSGILGEVVKCYILEGSTTLTFEEISKLLMERLEPYKRPVVYEMIDKIPVTASGKKQRTKLI
jgi:long-chain acyl-CoA synthetase